MSGILASVDRRTRLVGENRLELLIFRLNGRQAFAINVFKVQEVLRLQNLVEIPHSHHCVRGVTSIRNKTIPVIDLGQAIGMRSLEQTLGATIIVTEYNRSVQAFLVASVEHIVNMNWEEIHAPPPSAGRAHYLTAITRYDNEIVEVIDVEKVLSEIVPYCTEVSANLSNEEVLGSVQDRFILIVDDSPVAITQARNTLQRVGLKVEVARNGNEALRQLRQWSREETAQYARLLMVLTDAEMPEMDGYRLTSEIRSDPLMHDLYVIMHTSLSGSFNQSMIAKVGCDDFLSKFQPDELVSVVVKGIRAIQSATKDR
jgi:two-component system chemotaxis response regulator CheV